MRNCFLKQIFWGFFLWKLQVPNPNIISVSSSWNNINLSNKIYPFHPACRWLALWALCPTPRYHCCMQLVWSMSWGKKGPTIGWWSHSLWNTSIRKMKILQGGWTTKQFKLDVFLAPFSRNEARCSHEHQWRACAGRCHTNQIVADPSG